MEVDNLDSMINERWAGDVRKSEMISNIEQWDEFMTDQRSYTHNLRSFHSIALRIPTAHNFTHD